MPKKRTYEHDLHIRMESRHYERIRRASYHTGIKLSEWCRVALIEASERTIEKAERK